ncbi:hypothetical protein P3T36_005247 [Kitasatospora sp. MAP12-15]|uniref:phytanoyl-CoA dioxygenase family protein n=1 Tax=unclassified Kitasatospora TaxID=2633591 RepID=UPI0024762A11|nr:phytanoyl-CoA dioxygenase family protein [Kitasatospora sp. MAP12-44]MDH6113590.1 hypothetical protein [Kitasatospora sp. MAP12-44]
MADVELRDEALLESWHSDGFFLVPRLIGPAELDAVAEELANLYPTGADFAADVDPERNARYRDPADAPGGAVGRGAGFLAPNPVQFAGQLDFPWAGRALNRLAVHPQIVALAVTLLGTADLRIYQAQLWAKYAGATNYAQPLHLDYSSHTLLVPKRDSRPRQVEMFLYLSDITDGRGPTRLVPRRLTRDLPPVPYRVWPGTHPHLYRAEVSCPGPAGSLLVYAPDIWHRAVDLTEPGGSRLWMNLSYKPAGADWLGLQSFLRTAMSPHWQEFVAGSTPEELQLFGFPPPGHDAYDRHVLDGMSARYPGLDVSAWQERLPEIRRPRP